MLKLTKRLSILIISFVMIIGSVLPNCVIAEGYTVETEFKSLKFKPGCYGFTRPLYYSIAGDQYSEIPPEYMNGFVDTDARVKKAGVTERGADTFETVTLYIYTFDESTVNCYVLGDDYESIRAFNIDMRADGYTTGSEVNIRPSDKEGTDLSDTITEEQHDFTGETAYWEAPAEKSFFQQLEEILAGIVRGTANGLIKIINWAVGGSSGVTIDDILFNHFEPTKIDYFNGGSSNSTRESSENKSADSNNEKSLSAVMVDTITTWTNVFTQIAVTGYLAALLYIGIQILFRSTGQRQAEYKRLLVDWVIGIGLLFFFPLVAKYSIEINDALVAQIESAKSENAVKGSEVSYTGGGVRSLSPNATTAQKIEFGMSMDESPFSSDNGNYMVKMAKKAESTKRLSYAIVYMIMAWQLLMILITYYRRVFMIGFLLVLFPLVSLSYAFDKIKDGKSQAFDRWAKELMINVFLQTFHALIYVFALNACFAGGEQNDWLLMIIGVSFLFRGEEIIKGLFGQKSDTAASLSSSALKTAAVFTAVRMGAEKLKDNATSIKKAIDANRNRKMYRYMANNFDMLASTGPEFTPNPYALPNAPINNMDSDAIQLGNDIQTINNRDVVTPQALAQAIYRVQNYHGAHPQMLQDLNIDITKLKGMQDIKEGVIRQLKSGSVDKATIEQNIKLELETLFGADEAEKMRQVLYHQMSMPLNSNHLKRNTTEGFVKKELQDARDRKAEMENSFKFSKSPTSLHDIDFTNEVSDMLYDNYGTSSNTKEQIIIGRSIAILKNRDSSKYKNGFSMQQQVTAMKYVMEHKDDDEKYKDMLEELNEDVDELALTMANKIKEDAKTDASIGQKTRDWADNVVNHYMNDDNPLKDESQKISVLTIIKNENTTKSDDDIAKDIITDRIHENRDESGLLRDFAEERKTSTPRREPTLDGMTYSDILAMEENEKEIATKNLTRGIAETMGAATGVVPGIAAGIAFAETNKGPIAEGIAGGFAGAVVGDQIVGFGLGETSEREVWIRNPYTGEDEKVTLKLGGPLGDHISLNDPYLPENIRGHIDAQFRENAAKKRRVKEAQERAKIEKANRDQRLP